MVKLCIAETRGFAAAHSGPELPPRPAAIHGRRHQDAAAAQPDLMISHVNASVLKVKLATAIIGISSIHLLKTFINAQVYDAKTLIAQTLIHIAFLLSAIAIAYTDRLMTGTQNGSKHH
jgi:uncharacterized protein (TIGR00645 family)